jgi:putative MFS transporter
MMSIYSCFQGIAFYSFGNWLPTLLEARGVPLGHSLLYIAGVLLAAPIAPFAFAFLSDRLERKYQIVGCGLAVMMFALLFSQASNVAGWLTFGIGLAFCNSLIGFQSHTYQSEIFPTSVRARAVGFVYSFTRLAAAGSGYLVAYILSHFGVTDVFVALSITMLLAVSSIAVAGPRTHNRSFLQISGNIWADISRSTLRTKIVSREQLH